MNRKEIKRKAKSVVKYHIFVSILVCFVVTLIISNGYKFNTSIHVNSNDSLTNSITKVFIDNNNINIIENITKRTRVNNVVNTVTNYKPTRGVLSVFFNQINTTGSITMGVLNATNQFLFNNSLPSLIVLITSIIIFIIIYIFIQNIIIVGKNRFFLEHRVYQDTSFDKILFIYRVKKVMNVAKIMLLRDIKMLLWCLTIVMGPIKFYEYFMIPYILAENPEIDYKDCFKLSKEMTDGQKMNIFKLDLSMILWYLLGYITLGLSNIFYFNPYKESIYAEVYMTLRKNVYKDNKNIFKDKNLDNDNQKGEYPSGEYFIEEVKHKKWLKTNYEIEYSFINFVLLFFAFSMFGYIWEVVYTFLNEGLLVNRGTMYGPWIPIYGWGGILMTILLYNLRDKPFYMFLGAFILSGIIEYSTSLYLDIFYDKKWWDYSGYFLNINGRVCFEGLLVFALAGCTAIYFIIPHLDNLYKKMNRNIKIAIVIILVVIYCADFLYSTIKPNSGSGITIVSKK